MNELINEIFNNFMSSKNLNQYNKSRTIENNSQMTNEVIPEIKDIKSAKDEILLWIQTYKEIVEIFADIVPVSTEKQKNNTDKRSILLKLCQKVAKVAKDPKNSREYKILLKKLNECQNKMADLIRKNSAILNDTYNCNFDNEQIEAQLTTRLNNIDNLLSNEIEQNIKYLPNHAPVVSNEQKEPTKPSEQANQLPLAKKQSNIITFSQKKKCKSVFPPSSELLSPSFQKKSKNEILNFFPEKDGNQSGFDIFNNNITKIETNVPISNVSSIQIKDQVDQNVTPKANKSKKNIHDEIPFGKRPVSNRSRNRSRSKKS